MLNFSKLKISLIVTVCIASVIFAIPSLIGKNQMPFLPDQKLNLGLDLKGGSQLLLEVDFNNYHDERLKNTMEEIKFKLQESLIRFIITKEEKSINIKYFDESTSKKIKKTILEINPNIEIYESNNDFEIFLTKKEINKLRKTLISQSIEIIRRRIDENGTKEPTIQAQGENRILLQVPGVKDSSTVKRLLGKTAKMSFHFVSDATFSKTDISRIDKTKFQKIFDDKNRLYIIEKEATINGELLTDANPTYFEGKPAVSFKFNKTGKRKFAKLTSENIGRIFAIVLDNKIITAPRINSSITQGTGIISGSFTTQEATDLALLLRAGALPAPLEVIEERTVGPSLGSDSIKSGAAASILSLILIGIAMVVFYKSFGMIANVALVINICIIVSILSIFGSTLTLPGIAGIALTMGMSVDANVLIFERIKEEIKSKNNIYTCLENGFSQAFKTIVDSNLTTLIVALSLFIFGTGPVKGFAITLSIGILSSMFCSIMLTRMIILLYIKARKPKTILA